MCWHTLIHIKYYHTYTYKVLSHFLASVLNVITHNNWNLHALFNVYLKNKYLISDAESLDE